MMYGSRSWIHVRIFGLILFVQPKITNVATMQDCLLNVAILTMTDERFGLEILFVCLFVFGATAPQWVTAFSFARFLDHTQRLATVG